MEETPDALSFEEKPYSLEGFCYFLLFINIPNVFFYFKNHAEPVAYCRDIDDVVNADCNNDRRCI